jgi:hypothetical protein
MKIKEYLLSNVCSFTLSDLLINKIKELDLKVDEAWIWDEIDSWETTDSESHEARVEKLVNSIQNTL